MGLPSLCYLDKAYDQHPLSFLLPCGAGAVTIFVSLGWQGIAGCFGSPKHGVWL